mmetsp:Transcript_31446/g.67924  ORF Transcript_31446/g.67924 Transcript_31446/m.67924 type:complete len:120 (+) Transcript_31446:256-615(+)
MQLGDLQRLGPTDGKDVGLRQGHLVEVVLLLEIPVRVSAVRTIRSVDFSFYILVVIVLLALVAGIIIDSFGALRDESTKKMDLLRNVCIVCGQTRTAFQDIPGGFEQHVRVPRVLLGVD